MIGLHQFLCQLIAGLPNLHALSVNPLSGEKCVSVWQTKGVTHLSRSYP